MTRTLRGSLLIALIVVFTWATSSEACHRRSAYVPATSCDAGYTYASPTGYYGAGGGYGMVGGGYYVPGRLWRRHGRLYRRVRVAAAGYPGVRVRPALQPGRPRRAGVRAGGAARPGRRRLGPGALTGPQVLRSSCGGAPADLLHRKGRTSRGAAHGTGGGLRAGQHNEPGGRERSPGARRLASGSASAHHAFMNQDTAQISARICSLLVMKHLQSIGPPSTRLGHDDWLPSMGTTSKLAAALLTSDSK